MSPKARLFRHEKFTNSFGNTTEIKIWIVPVSVHHPNGVKYSLVYVVNGVRVLGFDNEQGKVDHVHLDGVSPLHIPKCQRSAGGFYPSGERVEGEAAWP